VSTDPQPLLVDSRTAARMLAVSPRTLWSLTRQKTIQIVRIGRAVRFAVSELQRFVEQKKGSEQ